MKTKIVVAIGGMGLAIVLFSLGVVFLGTYTWRACPRTSYPEIELIDVRPTTYFSSSYQAARESFLEAARPGGGTIESIENPHTGPDGERLFTDVVLFGPTDAKTILVLSSGTHGVEGFAGSGIQTGLLREGIASTLPPGVGLVMIHAINPYGMAHLRRFNEDNVDLNRNFRDHAVRPPKNPQYDELADVIAPRSMSFWSEVGSWSRILWYRVTAGKSAAQMAVSGGQYSHPEGLFYGGTFDTWSNKTIRSIAERYLSGADQVIVVDVHTALGAFGNGEIILNVPKDSAAYGRAVEIWGPTRVRSTVTDESVSIHLEASLKLALTEMLSDSVVTAVSLEFGTLPQMEVFKALRAENWLHHHGGMDHPRAKKIKTCLLRAFHPDSDEWEASVWNQGMEVVEQALAWLSARTSRP